MRLYGCEGERDMQISYQGCPCKIRLVAAMAMALVLFGCGTSPKKPSTQGEARSTRVISHYSNSRISQDGDEKSSSNSTGNNQIYLGSGVTVKPSVIKSLGQDGGELSLNFENADLREVVKTILSDILMESYIMDPRVSGSITMHTKRPIPKSAVLPTLETVLRMSGAVLLRQEDGVVQVLPANMAGKGNLTPRLGDVNKPLPNGYSIQIVPLKFIGATDMVKLLEPLQPEAGAIRIDLIRNLLILSGTEPELRHMFETIDMFDVDWLAGMSVGIFTLQNVEIKTITGELEKVFGDKSSGPLAGVLRLIPIDRLNALLVVTPQAKYLDTARTWIERLDRSGVGGGGPRLFVYQVQNGRAEQLAQLVNDVFSKSSVAKTARAASLAPGLTPAEVKSSDARPAPTAVAPAPSTSSIAANSLDLPQNIRVIADTDNNALLILASGEDYEKIEIALRKLDVVPRQVLIEVTIAEITLKDELSYGLEWYMKSGSRISGQLDTGASGIAKLAPGLAYSWTSKTGDITAILNMLASDSKLKIVSSPHITVADNQKASIQVGDQVPTITQTQSATGTTTGVISSVQYLNTGVLLNVTPRVNAGGLVTLEINQEISNASKTTSSSIDSPTIQKRSAQSTVTVQSNETFVLAGLIKEENSSSSDGLPYLSRIPLLGGLFGAQSESENRTELIILITPRVLHTVAQASEVTEAYRSRMSGLEEMLSSLSVTAEDRQRAAVHWKKLPTKPATGPMPLLNLPKQLIGNEKIDFNM